MLYSKWFLIEFGKNLTFPVGMSVFDVWVDPNTQEYTSWNERFGSKTIIIYLLSRVPTFELDSDVPLQACLVHNAETIRVKYFIDMLVECKFPLMLIGLAGSGKTLMLNDALGHLDEEYAVANVPLL